MPSTSAPPTAGVLSDQPVEHDGQLVGSPPRVGGDAPVFDEVVIVE